MARILIIEDNDDLRTIVTDALIAAGHEVIQAADGVEGIESQRNASADLVITDILMPEKEGIETIRDLTREFPALPIIAMSGAGRSQSANALPFIAKELGAHAFLRKPFGSRDLLEAVQKVLERAPG